MITSESEISQVNPKCPEQTCVSSGQNLACFGCQRFPPAPDPGTLIRAFMVNRQACEISQIAATLDFPFDPNSSSIRVSLIEWKNIILYGKIKIDSAKLRMPSA